jgi:two-component system, chemotaxis family, sensor kinase CheA
VVRDLAIACGKEARLDMEGQDTELDKTIVEAIRDPLTHLVRNAVDHGIEAPAQRIAAGKNVEGHLRLHAFHEGGKVVIEISDDGAGVDPQRVRDKAVKARLISAEQADRLSEHELTDLLFLPGFSTAERITQFSGRGVGMDVVRTNIEQIGGLVNIESRPGRGTTIRMKIPLTLAIIPALTITCDGDRYAIPQVNLLELVRLEAGGRNGRIEQVHGAAVYRLRGQLLPLVFLDRELHPRIARTGLPTDAYDINIVVLQADERQFGLVVDAIHDTEEIVVKPVQKQLKGISVFAGATIMGDGRVALILDVLGLAKQAQVISGAREQARRDKPVSNAGPTADRHAVLVFATREGGRMAVPLTAVYRLEEFPRQSLERAGTRDVVQYRNEILPLVDVSSVLGERRRYPRDSSEHSLVNPAVVQVVVHARGDRRIGLVVERIVDIVEETLDTRSEATRPGVLFSAVVQGRVTEFLDIDRLFRSLDHEPQTVRVRTREA